MGQLNGVYVMRVASMLTGMHPQTLRKYERAGLLKPTRSKKLRMYSEEDISRLKLIKHLIDKAGLNIAGVKMALELYESATRLKKELHKAGLNGTQVCGQLINDILGTLDTKIAE